MASERTEITFRYERWRAVTSGILETASQTFLLLILLRVPLFEPGAIAKALVSGGGSVGLLLSPLTVALVEAKGWRTAQAAATLAAVGAVCFLAMAFIPSLPVYVIGSILGTTCATSAIPLVTQIYQENYPASQRGRRFSRTVMIRILAAAGFSQLGGYILSDKGDNFEWLLVIFAISFAFASYCFARCPSRPLKTNQGTHPFRSLRYLRSDPLFRHTLIAWGIMGFGNLMMFPMRVEYLGNPSYVLNFEATPVYIALITGVIPNLVRLFFSPIWGWLFDHINFFVLRISLNICFAVGILVFFSSQSLTGFIIGATIFGMASGGGDVAWSLWVTKFAPPERVADYMSVHTFFTGARGLLAPLVAFNLIRIISLPTLSWISVGLICVATVLLVPTVRYGRQLASESDGAR